MSTPNDNQIVGSGHGILVVVAAPVEANAVRVAFGTPERSDGGPDEPWKRETLAPGFDLIVTGVGKAQAAGGTAWAYDPARHRGVVSIGIGGALPAREPARIGDTVLATRSVFADEGVCAPDRFIPIEAIGFGAGRSTGGFGPDGMACAPAWADALASVCTHRGVIATVSSCSGTDNAARRVAMQTGAIAENMEGAAVAAALSRLESPPLFAEIRVISNTTGDREHQNWDLERALAVLRETAERVARALETGDGNRA